MKCIFMVANVFNFPVSHPSLSNHSYKGPLNVHSGVCAGAGEKVRAAVVMHSCGFHTWLISFDSICGAGAAREAILIPKSCQD